MSTIGIDMVEKQLEHQLAYLKHLENIHAVCIKKWVRDVFEKMNMSEKVKNNQKEQDYREIVRSFLRYIAKTKEEENKKHQWSTIGAEEAIFFLDSAFKEQTENLFTKMRTLSDKENKLWSVCSVYNDACVNLFQAFIELETAEENCTQMRIENLSENIDSLKKKQREFNGEGNLILGCIRNLSMSCCEIRKIVCEVHDNNRKRSFSEPSTLQRGGKRHSA